MYCDFEKVEDGKYKCKNCGLILFTDRIDAVQLECEFFPSIFQQAAHYASAVTKHIITGAHTRTDEEILELLSICKACDNFDKDKDKCKLCGCNCNMNRSAYTNKLRMASEHCPANKW